MNLQTRLSRLEKRFDPRGVCLCRNVRRPYAVYYDDDPMPVVAPGTCSRCLGRTEPVVIHVVYDALAEL